MRFRPGLVAVLVCLLYVQVQAQQPTPDQIAEQTLSSARRAYNEKQYPVAAQRFREYLQKFPQHRDINWGRYGLALALLDGPLADRDLKVVIDNLAAVSNEFSERPFSLYQLGYAYRLDAETRLAMAADKPNEAQQHRTAALDRYNNATSNYALAATLFERQAAAEPADKPSTSFPWAVRARLDTAEMLLLQGKFRETLDSTNPFILTDKYRKAPGGATGVYYQGYAYFMLKEYQRAGQTLISLAPFADPIVGPDTRYLLGRINHIQGDRLEAAAHYDAATTAYENLRKTATILLQNPASYGNRADVRVHLENLSKGAAFPESMMRAYFYSGLIAYEDGKFSDAQSKFASYVTRYPNSPLLPEAQLRLGFTHVQMKQSAEAIRILQPLEPNPRLADQVNLWLARAYLLQHDPSAKPEEIDTRIKLVRDHLRKALERTQNPPDQDVRLRRGDILLEIANVQMLMKQFKEAATTYNTILAENISPERVEEALQLQAVAFQQAGMFQQSDEACQRFFTSYPKSTLMPSVRFRYAENAFLSALATSKQPNLQNREQTLRTLFAEAMTRHLYVTEKYPEFPHINYSRYSLASSYYEIGMLDKAQQWLELIPTSERVGELATASYLEADCLLRQLTIDTSDALAAGRAQLQLGNIIKLLDQFTGSQPNHAQVPEALLRLGFCYQQNANLIVEPQARQLVLAQARAVYEKLIKEMKDKPQFAHAVFERAKVMGLQGDPNGASQSLNQFSAGQPLADSTLAPLALLRQAGFLRQLGKSADAVKVLTTLREQEATLLADPARAAWVPAIQYHQGLALRDTGKLAEARLVFEGVAKAFATRPEAAESAWRAAQCRREEAVKKIADAQPLANNVGAKPEDRQKAVAAISEGWQSIRDAAQYLLDQAGSVGQRAPGSEAHLRLLYESAWVNRTLIPEETNTARQRLQTEAHQRAREDFLKKNPGQKADGMLAPEIPLSAVPLQPAEQKARDAYKALIAANGDAPLSIDARFEYAELLSQRNEFDAAVRLLIDALDKDVPPALSERMRFRLGICQLGRKNTKAALAIFSAMAKDPKSPFQGEATYRAGEALMIQADIDKNAAKDLYTQAIAFLAPIRDNPPFHNLAGVSDAGLLRLGHAHAFLGQLDVSLKTLETMTQRFPQSTWAAEAFYLIGTIQQTQKNFDAAVLAYDKVTSLSMGELAAKAQIQKGICRMDQKRPAEAAKHFVAVWCTYDYPEQTALALLEAARAHLELKELAEAKGLLERIQRDHGKSTVAEPAKQLLGTIKLP